ncbi:MAG: EamA family transporter, partial [Roseobacter sp.]
FLFAVSGVCYRGASLVIPSDDPVTRAGLTLAVVTTIQMLGMGFWLWRFDAPQIAAVWQVRRVAVWIGLTSLAGSFCWFLAFTLQVAAFVKAVGQVEMVLGIFASTLFFGERIGKREYAGIAVLCGSIVALVLIS